MRRDKVEEMSQLDVDINKKDKHGRKEIINSFFIFFLLFLYILIKYPMTIKGSKHRVTCVYERLSDDA